MPTKDDLDKLADSSFTEWTWCDGDDTNYCDGCTLAGYKVTGLEDYADNSIFLPAAGFDEVGLVNQGEYGCYWSSIPSASSSSFYLYEDSGNRMVNYTYSNFGVSVRAILNESN